LESVEHPSSQTILNNLKYRWITNLSKNLNCEIVLCTTQRYYYYYYLVLLIKFEMSAWTLKREYEAPSFQNKTRIEQYGMEEGKRDQGCHIAWG